MDYHRIYRDICASPSLEDEYCEVHHILPRCMGGTDDPSNLVRLAARRHFVAHMLLARMYPQSGLVHAASMMSNIGRYGSRKYSWLRKLHAARVSARLKGIPLEKTEARWLAWRSEERNERISRAHKGKAKSEAHRKNMSLSRLGKTHSEEWKANIGKGVAGERNGMFGKTHTADALERMSKANKSRVTCPHCGKEGGIAVMPRWHFDRCKEKI